MSKSLFVFAALAFLALISYQLPSTLPFSVSQIRAPTPLYERARLSTEQPEPCGLKGCRIQDDQFAEYLDETGFDWDNFRDSEGWPKKSSEVTKMLYILSDFIAQEPFAPIKVDTRPEPLPEPSQLDCNAGLFRGHREKPAYIVDIILFAYEVEILEIRLFEIYDVVDEIILWEGSWTHRGDRKPLVFEKVLPRFQRFMDKIVRIVEDDREIPKMQKRPTEQIHHGKEWMNENRMRQSAIEGYLEFKNGTLPDDHLLIFTDIDEVPSSKMILDFKHCNVNEPYPIKFSTNLYRFDLEHRSISEPWWTASVMTKVGLAQRKYKTGLIVPPHHGWAGAHLNRCVTPAGLAFKLYAVAEEGQGPETRDLKKVYNRHKCKWFKDARTVKAEEPGLYYPWFAEANKERFPFLWPSLFPEWGVNCNAQWRLSNAIE